MDNQKNSASEQNPSAEEVIFTGKDENNQEL